MQVTYLEIQYRHAPPLRPPRCPIKSYIGTRILQIAYHDSNTFSIRINNYLTITSDLTDKKTMHDFMLSVTMRCLQLLYMYQGICYEYLEVHPNLFYQGTTCGEHFPFTGHRCRGLLPLLPTTTPVTLWKLMLAVEQISLLLGIVNLRAVYYNHACVNTETMGHRALLKCQP